MIGKNRTKDQIILILIFLLSSAFDAIGLGMIGAFLAAILNIDVLMEKIPIFFREHLYHFDHDFLFSIIGSIIILAFLMKTVVGLYSQKRIVLFSTSVSAEVKNRLISLYQMADYVIHLSKNTGEVLNNVQMVDRLTAGFIIPTLNFMSNLLTIIGILSILFLLHPDMTVMLIGAFSAIIGSYNTFIRKELREQGEIMSRAGAFVNKNTLQALGGILEIRVLGKEHFFLENLDVSVKAYSKANSLLAILQSMPRYIIELGAALFLVLSVLIGLWLGKPPAVIVPAIGVFAAGCLRLLPMINQCVGAWNQMQGNNYTLNGVCNVLIALEKHQDRRLKQSDNEAQPFHSITLKHISYQYPSGKEKAISDLSISIYKGQSIGIVGTSGAGKSTLVNILLGVLNPTQGQILINDTLLENKRTWLSRCAYIPQQIFLLDDTLKRNIAFGLEDNQIEEVKLTAAIQMAQLESVVDMLPKGLDTLIGENGIRLSGGQRQRVALARAFYHERDVIIMDEATSALDSETEKEVIGAIKRLHGVKTLIIIAHRLTTIEHCDVVYKLEKGRVIAKGALNDMVNV